LGLKGPLNIQGRLTENGLKIFEMNPRFTGISGMRALMGFNEVEACIKEWMDIDKGKNHIYLNHNRFGTRQISDKSIPIERSTGIISQFKHILSKEISRKTLLITGAGGYIGRNLIKMLAEDCSFNVWAYDIDKKRIEEIFKGKVQKVFDYNDLINGRMNLGYADILVHLGFARPYCTYLMIADSLKFTFDLFSLASMNQIPAILNFSSKSVYGMDNSLPWKESTPVVPQTVYAQAKYATELYLDTLKRRNNVLHFSSLRLSSISGGADGLTEVDALSKISRNAFKAEPIRIIGGSQLLEYLDIRDAVDAVIKMLKTDSEKWKPVYNIGANNKYKLTDIVEKSVNIAQKYNGGRKSEIIFENKDIDYKIDMDSSLFYNDFNWFPKYRIDDTIESLMVYFQKRERKV
jgi:nucleoside-diphosphate-sugar epimerase